jgi:hypothetical protein
MMWVTKIIGLKVLYYLEFFWHMKGYVLFYNLIIKVINFGIIYDFPIELILDKISVRPKIFSYSLNVK